MQASPNSATRRERYFVLLAVAVLLLCLAYWRTISTYRAPYRLLTDLPIPPWVDALYAYRWLVRGAMLAAGLALAVLELWASSVTRLLRGVLAGRWSLLLLLAVLTLAGRSYLLTPGRIALIDGLANVANVLAIRVALEAGHLPPYYWSNFAFMGFPWLQFHNSAFYYEGALLDLLLRDGFLSTKLTLLANHVLGAWAMFHFVRRVARSAFAGLVSAAVWATAFFHYHYFVHVGSIHLSLLLPLLPAGLWCVEAVLEGGRRRLAAVALAAITSLLLWAHPYYAIVSVGLIGLYALARLFAPGARSLGPPGRAGRLAWIAGGLALGGLAAISQVLPPVIESGLVAGGNQSAGLRVPFPDLQHVLSFRGSFLTPDWWGGYLGLSVTALAGLGAIGALGLRDRRAYGLLAWLAVAWFLSLGMAYLPYDWIEEHLPFGNAVIVVAGQRKYLMFLEFALAALAGVALRGMALGLRALARRRSRLTRRIPLLARRAALLAAAAISTEMIFLTLQVNSLYPEEWVGMEPGRATYLDWLNGNGDGASRLLDTYLGNLEAWALSGQPSFISHYEEQPPSGGGVFVLMDAVRQDATAGSLRRLTRDQLYLLDIGYLALDQPPPPDSRWQLAIAGEPFSLWQMPEHSPIVAAPAVLPLAALPSSSLSDLVLGMELDPGTNSAAHIPALVAPAGGAGAANLLASRLAVHDYQVELTYVRLDYELSDAAYLQLSYSAYPYLHVYLDGERVETFSTAFHLVGLYSPAGRHRIELRPVLSPLRVVSYWLDVVGLLGIVLAAAWPGLARRRRR